MNRQVLTDACRWGVMAAFIALGALATQPAEGQVGLELEVEVTGRAPAQVAVGASVDANETVIAYDWRTLPTAQPCRAETCTYDSELLGCRWVEAEVTTLRGDVERANTQACVEDTPDEAPRAELVVEVEGSETRVRGRARDGKVATLFTRMWVDDRGPFDGDAAAVIDVAKDCHVVDVLVADADGRVSFLSRRFCAADAPRAWVGPSAVCPPIGATQSLCADVEHPLGLDVETSSVSEIDRDDCTTERVDGRLDRRVFVVRDERGMRGYASAFMCGSAPNGRMMFADDPSPVSAEAGSFVTFRTTVYGGTPPFSVSSDGPRVTVQSQGAEPTFELEAPIFGDRMQTVEVTLQDAEGRVATFDVQLRLAPGSIISPSSDEGASCRTTTGSEVGLFALLGAVLLFLRRRYR
ncbi:MAG: hypothetical protein RIT81_01825 [Deltaproteobacteria bacterium]